MQQSAVEFCRNVECREVFALAIPSRSTLLKEFDAGDREHTLQNFIAACRPPQPEVLASARNDDVGRATELRQPT